MADQADELAGRTWHHGLVARWWRGMQAKPEELAYYAAAIRRFGEPALDLACGTGRLTVPLRQMGLDVDGVDLSEDMIEGARERATAEGVTLDLRAQPMHELDLPRRYRTIFICDSWGIGGSRPNDRQTLQRVHDHLEPGGALVMSTGFPYDDESEWRLWLPNQRDGLPREWPDTPGRQEQPDGDVLVQQARLSDLDPRAQRIILAIRTSLVHDEETVRTEEREIAISVYFEQELRLMLELAGFTDVAFEAGYTGTSAGIDDTDVVVVARKSDDLGDLDRL